MSETIRRRLFVTGRVQGVSFRWFTRREAAALGLRGFVRNLVDGRVEAEAEGPAEDVNLLIDRVRAGPPGSRVDDVTILPAAVRGDEDGFRIEATIG